jgi:hypothetical protein
LSATSDNFKILSEFTVTNEFVELVIFPIFLINFRNTCNFFNLIKSLNIYLLTLVTGTYTSFKKAYEINIIIQLIATAQNNKHKADLNLWNF